MSNLRKFIAVDLGAESGRVVVAKMENRLVELVEVRRFTTRTIEFKNTLRWDIPAIIDEVIKGLSEASARFGTHFDGVAVDTWGVDYVLIGRDGRILEYPFHYRDGRTDNIMDKAFRILTPDELYAKSGIQFAQFNTLFQLLAEKNVRSDSFESVEKLLLMPDFINYLLSGKEASEFTIASTSGLTDPIRRDWEWSLIGAFEFPARIFPAIVEPGHRLGNLLRSVANQTGLSEETPVFATACHDTGSAVVSIPAISSESWAFLSSGTWSLMGIEVTEPIRTGMAMKHNFTNEGGAEGTTRFLKNIMGLWPLQECRRDWEDKFKVYAYDELTEMAAAEGVAGTWIDLNDPRFLRPGDMPARIIEYLKETGQRVRAKFGFIVRVILESLAFSCRFTKREIEAITGQRIEVLYAVGGGTHNSLLMQLTADAIGCPVVAGPVEGTVVGNVGVQALASGAIPNIGAWRRIVADSFPLITYEPKDTLYFQKNESTFGRILSNRISVSS